MDIGICSVLSIIAIFLPLFYALYLFGARLSLSFVPKKVLNSGCFVVNLISFVLFLLLKIPFINKTGVVEYDFNFFSIEKFSLNFGFSIDETNISYLIIASLLCWVISLYSKYYFDIKKQFIFTKQRYYVFLALISFLTYAFLASSNLFEGVIALMLQSYLIAVFAYYDIFKYPKNYNVSRFHRISLLGNFSLLVSAMILFRYAILSQGYIASNSINYSELNVLMSYTWGISGSIEFKIMVICLIVAIMSRLMIFPMSCYYSFFANSSNIMYLSVIGIVNNISGMFLYLKVIPLIQLFKNYILIFEILIILGALVSLIQILFERNIKIVFGYLLSAINSIFVILFLFFNVGLIQNIYFAFNLIFVALLMILFINDKNNFKKRLINRQIGFALEKSHIVLFEVVPQKISLVFDVLDEKVIQKITALLVAIFNYFISLFVVKTTKTTKIKNIRNILLIIIFFILLAIFATLFGDLIW